MPYKKIKILDAQTAKKIAAGEVIERPASVVRELLDNAIDAEANRITVELIDGGIKSICVSDNGFGMSESDLAICTETHSTSKISSIEDLVKTKSLGFRGEALASINAVSDLEIISTQAGPLAHKFFAGKISATTLNKGTIVSVKNLFENFPARKKFLKLAATESRMCRQSFVEKALAHPQIEMLFKNNDKILLKLPRVKTFKARSLAALNIKEPPECFFEIDLQGSNFTAKLVLGIPDIAKSNRQMMYIFANGRRIDEYGLLQALDYGAEPYFPNGMHPVALAFLNLAPESIDFNIHPAKREARFSNYAEIHKVLSSGVAQFYKAHTIATMKAESPDTEDAPDYLNFLEHEISEQKHFENYEKRQRYDAALFQNTRSYQNAEEQQSIQNKTFTVRDASIRYQQSGLSDATFRPRDITEAGFKFLGQVAGTFIAVEKNDSLYFIDQHAAHERILFDELKQSARHKQELLVPYRIEAESDEEAKQLKTMEAQLAENGFETERLSETVWSVVTVPALWHGSEADLSADIKKALAGKLNLINEILALAACRAACKDGDILSPAFAFDLAKKTFALPEPVCPHGRPLWIVITREELFKRIKRSL